MTFASNLEGSRQAMQRPFARSQRSVDVYGRGRGRVDRWCLFPMCQQHRPPCLLPATTTPWNHHAGRAAANQARSTGSKMKQPARECIARCRSWHAQSVLDSSCPRLLQGESPVCVCQMSPPDVLFVVVNSADPHPAPTNIHGLGHSLNARTTPITSRHDSHRQGPPISSFARALQIGAILAAQCEKGALADDAVPLRVRPRAAADNMRATNRLSSPHYDCPRRRRGAFYRLFAIDYARR